MLDGKPVYKKTYKKKPKKRRETINNRRHVRGGPSARSGANATRTQPRPRRGLRADPLCPPLRCTVLREHHISGRGAEPACGELTRVPARIADDHLAFDLVD